MSTRNLEAAFAPRSVALVGASAKPGALGTVVAENLLRGRFEGPLMWVNRKGGKLVGAPVYAGVADLPQAPDLAVIATPAETVPELIGQLGAKGCRAAVVLSAGFEGEGRAAELKQAIRDAARPHLLRIIGPNCLGLQAPAIGLNASFAARLPPAGRVALVSQSGAIAAAAIDAAADLGIGFSHVVTVGDCADVDVGDALDWLAVDRATDAVLIYLEGVGDARKFMSAGRAAAQLKPVAVLKAGKSPAAAQAALTHTGALAGATQVYAAAFRRAGLVEVQTLGELLEAGAAFGAGLRPAGDTLAILTNGGGAAVLALDALSRLGERTVELSPATLAALDAIAPPHWSRRNPVDLLGDAKPALFQAAVRQLLDAPEVEALMVLNCPTAVADSVATAAAVARAAGAEHRKPVLAAWLGGSAMDEPRLSLAQAGVAAFATPEAAAGGYARVAQFGRLRRLLTQVPPLAPEPPDASAARALVEQALGEGRRVLTDPEARRLLAAYGIPVIDSREAATPKAAGAIAAALAGPVALKILSRQLSHKSDVGGVRLGLAGQAETEAAAHDMLAAVTTKAPQALIEGFIVEPMAQRPHAEEILVGVVQDAAFGPVVLVGHGGIATQVLEDRALGLPPLNEELAREMIAQTRVSRLLAGFRGRPPADLPALARTLVALGRLATDLPQVAELDINPLLCDDQGVLALDARVGLAPTGARGVRPAIMPYPAHLIRRADIGGASLTIRPIRPDDAACLVAMAQACAPIDLRLRFGDTLRTLGPDLVANLTLIDYDRQMALVAEAANGEILGVGRLCADPAGEAAELALLVRSDQQGHGLGRRLLAELVAYGDARGLQQIWGETEPENGRMIDLARRLGFHFVRSGDAATVRLAIDLPRRAA